MTTANSPLASALRQLFDTEAERVALAAIRLAHSPHMPVTRETTEDDQRQMASGFLALMREDLLGESRATREYVTGVIIPEFVRARGDALRCVHWNGAFITLVCCELVLRVPAELRDAASDWFASFAGEYVADVARVALAAEAGLEAGR